MIARHELIAFNTATESENKIHDDNVAGRFGFTGGLVPGVDVFAYMAHVPLVHFGRDWLSQGAMHARFLKPVYDGDAASVEGREREDAGSDEIDLVVSARGETCAVGSAARIADGAAPGLAGFEELPAAETRPKASQQSLAVGTVLGRTREIYTAVLGRQHLQDVREELSLFDDGRIANPAWLLRRANYILALNVKLGPWIHSESRIRLHGLLTDGEVCETRAVVAEQVEKGGHRIVALDFTIGADERLVMSGRHWAIYEPRQVRAKAG